MLAYSRGIFKLLLATSLHVLLDLSVVEVLALGVQQPAQGTVPHREIGVGHLDRRGPCWWRPLVRQQPQQSVSLGTRSGHRALMAGRQAPMSFLKGWR